jgi:hypothetical protein
LTIAARRGDHDITEGEVEGKGWDAADFEPLPAELLGEQLLEPARLILLRKLNMDDEVRTVSPDRIPAHDELCWLGHGGRSLFEPQDVAVAG